MKKVQRKEVKREEAAPAFPAMKQRLEEKEQAFMSADITLLLSTSSSILSPILWLMSIVDGFQIHLDFSAALYRAILTFPTRQEL